MGLYDTLKIIEGQSLIKVFRAKTDDNKLSGNQRSFCSECGAHLWCYDEQWKEYVYPYASAIDTPLPEPPHLVHLMVCYLSTRSYKLTFLSRWGAKHHGQQY
jgi:hypothetical protein